MTKEQTQTAHEGNLPIMTVSELSLALKREVEESFAYVRIRGEISGFKRAASGHVYLTLKDADAVLDGVCWRGTAGRLSISPEDGMEVIATGRLTTYPARSKYQMVIDQMELAGEGALLKLLEERRRKLTEEGLFAAERKRPLPYLPEVIGVVTSPTGAVIRDILHRLADRFPRRVLLWPVLVQGKEAAGQIAAAINGFNQFKSGDATAPRPDVLIIARGGGSLEDLWAFNEEIVVRAAALSEIPLISAVGHETDTTLIDFASDVRAPTPTAAAEMAVPVRTDLVAHVMEDSARLVSAVSRIIAERSTRLEGLVRGLPNLPRLVEESVQRLDDWAERLTNSLRVGLQHHRAQFSEIAAKLISPRQIIAESGRALTAESKALRLATDHYLTARAAELKQASALLESYSYVRTLDRGFALVKDDQDQLVRSVSELKPGKNISVQLSDGKAGATVTGQTPTKPPKEKSQDINKPKPSDKQGTLL